MTTREPKSGDDVKVPLPCIDEYRLSLTGEIELIRHYPDGSQVRQIIGRHR